MSAEAGLAEALPKAGTGARAPSGRVLGVGMQGGLLIASVLAAVLCGAPRGSRAEAVPAPGLVDSRVRVAPFVEDQVYRLRGFVGYQIDVEFQAGESFLGLGAGDVEGLSYFAQANHLFLKPKAPGVTTNLTVLTDRRRYRFDYLAMPRHPVPSDPDVIYALRFSYADTPAETAAVTEARRVDAELAAAAHAGPRNIDYWYCGEPALRPIAASDDGVHTRLRFAEHADLPAIFVRGEDGSESLLNFSMSDGDVIIHRVARRFLLRRGRSTGCVVNQAFVGGGARLDSGTIAPGVRRTVPGAIP